MKATFALLPSVDDAAAGGEPATEISNLMETKAWKSCVRWSRRSAFVRGGGSAHHALCAPIDRCRAMFVRVRRQSTAFGAARKLSGIGSTRVTTLLPARANRPLQSTPLPLAVTQMIARQFWDEVLTRAR